jgi:hypothetical protein
MNRRLNQFLGLGIYTTKSGLALGTFKFGDCFTKKRKVGYESIKKE